MKKVILTAILFFHFLIGISQGLRNNEIYTKEQIETTLKEDLKQVISRDDRLSFAVKDLNFIVDKNSKYMVDVSIDLFEENDLNKPKKTYSYVFKNLQEIEKAKTINFSIAYDQIFVDVDIKKISYVSVDISFTKLSDAQASMYKEKLSGLFDIAFSSFKVGSVIKKVLGATEEKSDEKISFSSKYYVPLNFEEHFEKIRSGTPVLIQSKDMIIAIAGVNKINNNSLFGKLKSFINAGSQIICNQNIIPENDLEKITGYCTFSFSKMFNSSLPHALDIKLKELLEEAKGTEIEKIDVLIKAVDDKSRDYLAEDEISRRTFDNIKMITSLISINNLRNKEFSKNFGEYKAEVVNKFSNWLDNASSDAANYNLTQINIRGIYQNGLRNNKIAYNDGIIYIPYSLNNDVTIYAIKLQQKMHDYVNSFLSTNANYQALVKAFVKQHEN